MRANQLSLLIVDEDYKMRRMLVSSLSDRYRSVTAAPFAEIGSFIVLGSFDMMLVPRIESNCSKHAELSEAGGAVSAIRSGVSGKIYDFKALNDGASQTVVNPFERVLIEVAIERAELACKQIERITKQDAIF